MQWALGMKNVFHCAGGHLLDNDFFLKSSGASLASGAGHLSGAEVVPTAADLPSQNSIFPVKNDPKSSEFLAWANHNRLLIDSGIPSTCAKSLTKMVSSPSHRTSQLDTSLGENTSS